MNRASTTLLGVTLGLLLGACAVKSSSDNPAKDAAKKGSIALKPVEISPEEAGYKWNIPQHPQEYKVDPLNRPALNGRTLAPLGSYAGPWLEGEEALLMPVANPNINMGNELLKKIDPSRIPAFDILEESPFQVFLKVRQALQGVIVPILISTKKDAQGNTIPIFDNQPIDKEQLWSVTMALYRSQEPDPNVEVPTKLDPKVKKKGSLTFGNCNMCHGADGWGAGHSGLTLQPPPANFHEIRRLYNRSEGKLRRVLQNGVYGSAMPQWNDKLSDEEIASVVAYVRSFSYSTEPILGGAAQ